MASDDTPRAPGPPAMPRLGLSSGPAAAGIRPGDSAGMPDRSPTSSDGGFRGRRDRLGLLTDFATRVLDHLASPRSQRRTLAQKQKLGLLHRSFRGGRR